jgi:uncharacterized protein (DUF2336 family)
MIIRAYLDWSRTASAAERAEAVAALANVFLYAEISTEDRRDAEAALVMALEDPSPVVRRALAVAIGGAERAPRAVIAALGRDQPEVAAVVVAISPVLTEAEVADICIFGSSVVQAAACARPAVGPGLCAALATVVDAPSAVTLLANPGAEVPLESLRLLTERLGVDPDFREAMLARDDLPPELRYALAEAAAQQLTSFVAGCGWLGDARAQRLRRESTESAAIAVVAETGDDAAIRLAMHLRRTGQLTPQLLMRAVLSGEVMLFAAALADLAEVDLRRARGFVMGKGSVGFGALYRKAGLPRDMEPAFAAALAAWQTLAPSREIAVGRLSRAMTEAVLSAIALLTSPDMERLRALLMGYQAEAARDEARARLADILSAAPPVEIEPEPLDDLALRLEDALALELREAA